MLEQILGVGIIAFVLVYLASTLKDGWWVGQLFLIMTALTFLIFIPAVSIDKQCEALVNETTITANTTTYTYNTVCTDTTENDTASTFHWLYLRFYYAVWLIIGVYGVYLILVKLGIIAGGSGE